MYRTVLSLLITVGLAIAVPVVVEKDSQTTQQVKHVQIKAVKSYLSKTKLGAKGLVNDFQDVLDVNPKGADIDDHRHIAKGYLPKAIQTIVAMREAADSMLQRIDENGLEKPQMIGGRQDCHQLKKSIDAIKEVDIENLCSSLKRQEIIAYFKSDLNCLLGSIFELWRASERDGAYLTLGYRDIIQTIKNLLVAIETGIRRFSDEINYMDFSSECHKYFHPANAITPTVHVPVQPKPHVVSKPIEEGKDKAKDEGKGVYANSVIVGGVVKTGESSLVEKVEKVIKLEQKELDDIKAAADIELEKVGGTGKNVTVGEVVGVIGAQKAGEEKKEEEGKAEEGGDGVGTEEENTEEKVEKEAEKEAEEKAEEEKVKEEEKEEERKEEEEKEAKAEKEEEEKKEEKEKVVEEEEKKEEAKENEEKATEKEVEKAKPEEWQIAPGLLLPVAAENDTAANDTTGIVEGVDEKLKDVLVNEGKHLNVVLHELENANGTSEGEKEDIKEEQKEIKKMMKELERVVAEVEAIDAMQKNKSAEHNVTIIDVITKSPVVSAKLTPKVDAVLPKKEIAGVATQGSILLTTVKPELPKKAPTTPGTNLKDVENEEKSLEILRSFGNDVFPADQYKPSKSDDQVLEHGDDKVIPETGETAEINDIDAQEAKDEEESAKKMDEEYEKEEEKTEEVKGAEKEKEEETKAEEETVVKGEEEEEKKESKEEEKKEESPVENKPVEKLVTTSKPAPVPAESKNSTMDGLISRINDEEAEVRNLIKSLNG